MSDRRRQTLSVPSMATEQGEEIITEVDEPPEETIGQFCWSPPNLCTGYMRPPPKVLRRESMLTRQLHSETEHTDEDPRSPVRALSTQSTWSNPSMAELTSDDGHSVASPAVSPPLPPQLRNDTSLAEKPLEAKVKIVGQDDVSTSQPKEASSEQKVEANLGRKRCISFACRGKEESKPVQPIQSPTSEPSPAEPASPPRRKSTLTFACPSKADAGNKPAEKTQSKRPVSPPPPARRSSLNTKHRGSDSTVTQVSPKATRKSSEGASAKESTSQAPTSTPAKRYSNESDDDTGNEGVRFHEFGTSEEEPEDWTQESTCYSKRLTVDDTLKKENYIRKTCEEAEEEVLEEEEEEEEEEELEEELAAADEMDAVDEMENDDGDETDEGFHSDDEEGFASSDSENDSDDSDFEWWRPGGLSTAATSVDQLDRLAFVNSQQSVQASSVGSVSSGQMSPHSSRALLRKASLKKSAKSINKADSPANLPDSTDFVCGTLDEDRPLEQAFVNRIKAKQAAKHNFRPQDIDPSFPTSDPEMDDEDDDENDVAGAADSEDEMVMMHGGFDKIDGDKVSKGRTSPLSRVSSKVKGSPPSPTSNRLHSPPPSKRFSRRSPPPQPRRSCARSPPPTRKLFGHSPQRTKSPAPVKRMTSPPNSPTSSAAQYNTAPHGLAGRPQSIYTASLPRGGGPTLGRLATIASDNERSDSGDNADVPKRGAIDIVKGLEKKRQWRKKKLQQKLNAKNATKGEKPYKVKPGTGAERMREVGLQLQEYQGKAEHILSL